MKNIPQPTTAWGWDLQGKRRIKAAGQQSEGEQEEQIPKEHGLRLSVWKNKTKRPAKTEGRLKELQAVAETLFQ